MTTVSELLATNGKGFVLAANFFTDHESLLHTTPDAEVLEEKPTEPHFWIECDKGLFEMAEGNLPEDFVFAVKERLETSLWLLSFRINKRFHFYVPPERIRQPH